MGILSFEVQADYENITRLRTRLSELERQIKGFGNTPAPTALLAEYRRVRSEFDSIASSAAKAGASIEQSFMSAKNKGVGGFKAALESLNSPLGALTGWLGVGALGDFVKNVQRTRSEFQLMEASINTILGSERRGKELMAELNEYAKVSPLDFQGSVRAAQQMLGFGIEKDKVIPYMKALGDVSMGDANKFRGLTLAFSQMSAAGKLMGQDLNQMVNWGFNPLDQMSKTTGKSIGQLKEEMSKGKITSAMVQQAFKDASSEGGKFFHMSDNATATISGQLSMLDDAFTLMYNDMGKASEGWMISAIQGATSVVDNYKEIGSALLYIIGLYGAFKGGALISQKFTAAEEADRFKERMAPFEAEREKQRKRQEEESAKAPDQDIRAAVRRGDMSVDEGREMANIRLANRAADDSVLQSSETAQAKLREAQARLANAEAARREAEQEITTAGLLSEDALGTGRPNEAAADSLTAEAEAKLRAAQKEVEDAQYEVQRARNNAEKAQAEAAPIAQSRRLEELEQKREAAEAYRVETTEVLANAQAKKEAADAAVEEARRGVEALQEQAGSGIPVGQDVADALNERLQGALAEQAQADADVQRAAQESVTAAKAADAAQTELQTAQQQANTVATGEGVAANQTHAASEAADAQATGANTTQTGVNTGRRTANTVAVEGGSAALAKHTLMQRLSAQATRVGTAVTNSLVNSVKGLWASLAANPLGMVLTAASALVGYFAFLKDDAEELSEAEKTFGVDTAKTLDSVKLYYNVLESTSPTSHTFAEAMKELTQISKDYGISLDNEADKYGALIKYRERIIALIEEEGRQKQIASQIEGMQASTKAPMEDLQKGVKEAIEDENEGTAKSNAAFYAAIIENSVRENAQRITELKEQARKSFSSLDFSGAYSATAEIERIVMEEVRAVAAKNGEDLKLKFGNSLFQKAIKGAEAVYSSESSIASYQEFLKQSEARTQENKVFNAEERLRGKGIADIDKEREKVKAERDQQAEVVRNNFLRQQDEAVRLAEQQLAVEKAKPAASQDKGVLYRLSQKITDAQKEKKRIADLDVEGIVNEYYKRVRGRDQEESSGQEESKETAYTAPGKSQMREAALDLASAWDAQMSATPWKLPVPDASEAEGAIAAVDEKLADTGSKTARPTIAVPSARDALASVERASDAVGDLDKATASPSVNPPDVAPLAASVQSASDSLEELGREVVSPSVGLPEAAPLVASVERATTSIEDLGATTASPSILPPDAAPLTASVQRMTETLDELGGRHASTAIGSPDAANVTASVEEASDALEKLKGAAVTPSVGLLDTAPLTASVERASSTIGELGEITARPSVIAPDTAPLTASVQSTSETLDKLGEKTVFPRIVSPDTAPLLASVKEAGQTVDKLGEAQAAPKITAPDTSAFTAGLGDLAQKAEETKEGLATPVEGSVFEASLGKMWDEVSNEANKAVAGMPGIGDPLAFNVDEPRMDWDKFSAGAMAATGLMSDAVDTLGRLDGETASPLITPPDAESVVQVSQTAKKAIEDVSEAEASPSITTPDIKDVVKASQEAEESVMGIGEVQAAPSVVIPDITQVVKASDDVKEAVEGVSEANGTPSVATPDVAQVIKASQEAKEAVEAVSDVKAAPSVGVPDIKDVVKATEEAKEAVEGVSQVKSSPSIATPDVTEIENVGEKVKQGLSDAASLPETTAEATRERLSELWRQAGEDCRAAAAMLPGAGEPLALNVDDSQVAALGSVAAQTAKTLTDASDTGVNPEADPKGVAEVGKAAQTATEEVNALNEAQATPEADATAIDTVSTSARRAQSDIAILDKSKAAPRTDGTEVDSLAVTADKARESLHNVGDTIVAPKVDGTQVAAAASDSTALRTDLVAASSKTFVIKVNSDSLKTAAKQVAEINGTPWKATEPSEEAGKKDKPKKKAKGPVRRDVTEEEAPDAFKEPKKNILSVKFDDADMVRLGVTIENLREIEERTPEEYRKRIEEAKNADSFNTNRKELKAKLSKLEYGSEGYGETERLLRKLEAREASLNPDKIKDAAERAYQVRKTREEEADKQAITERKNAEKLQDLRIAQMEEGSEKEIAKVRQDAAKKRAALDDEAKKEAKRLKDKDRQLWVKGGSAADKRKASQWRQSLSDEEYMRRARQNTGYRTSLEEEARKEAESLGKIYRKEAEEMRDFLKEFGTFAQRKAAIAEEYNAKIEKAATEGERLKLRRQERDDLQKVETEAVTMKIDWYSVFSNIGEIARGYLEPLYGELRNYVRTDDFRKSGAENQKQVVDAMKTMRETLGTTETWRDLAGAITEYQEAIGEATRIQAEAAKADEHYLALKERADAARAEMERLAHTPGADSGAVAAATESWRSASAEAEMFGTHLQHYSGAVDEAKNRVTTSGQMMGMTAESVLHPVSKITTLLNQSGLPQLGRIFAAIDQLKGGINALKVFRQQAKQAKEFAEANQSAKATTEMVEKTLMERKRKEGESIGAATRQTDALAAAAGKAAAALAGIANPPMEEAGDAQAVFSVPDTAVPSPLAAQSAAEATESSELGKVQTTGATVYGAGKSILLSDEITKKEKGEVARQEKEPAADVTDAGTETADAVRDMGKATEDTGKAIVDFGKETSAVKEEMGELRSTAATLTATVSSPTQGLEASGTHKDTKPAEASEGNGEETGGGNTTAEKADKLKINPSISEKLSGMFGGTEKSWTDALSEAGIWGQIASAALSLLDMLKDGIGTLISDIIDTVLQAVTGILNNLLSGEFAKQIFNSLVDGIGNSLQSVFSMGGLLDDVFGWGESDKDLHKDMERLGNSNDALRSSIDMLKEKIDESPLARIPGLYDTQRRNLEMAMANTKELMGRAAKAWKGGMGGSHSSNKRIDEAVADELPSAWGRVSAITGVAVRSASDFWTLTSRQMADVARDAPEIYALIKQYADDGHEDAAQYMDDYISYYRQLEDLEDEYRAKLTDVSLDSVQSEFKSTLADMASDSQDFADNFEKMMQQAVVNSLMADTYNEAIKGWYGKFAAAMEDSALTPAEQQALETEWDSIVDRATRDRDRIKEAMGWDESPTQQSSKRTLSGMTQDTAEAIEGRLTAIQIATEAIRSGEESQAVSLAQVTGNTLAMMQQFSRYNEGFESMGDQLARCHLELQTISENTGAIVKPIRDMQADIALIRRNTENI